VPPHFREYTVNKKYRIHYTEHLAKHFPSKAVFKGAVQCEEDETRHDVIIKFTFAYCEEAHRLLAAIGRAPNLRFCSRVESIGMYVVVMDYVSGERGETPLKDRTHIDQLRSALEVLHGGGYVYGDLRGPNVLIAADGPKLVDFDWCGKECTARYPVDINLDMDWHSEVRRGCLIKKAHDIYMRERLAPLPLPDLKTEAPAPPAV
jgi:serine/threonine protein kinase